MNMAKLKTTINCRQKGFTLFEVIVSIGILSLVLTAAINVQATSIEIASQFAKKTAGQWVALNKISEIKLSKEPASYSNTGESQQGKYIFYWQQTAFNTENTDIKRIEITIFEDANMQNYVTKLNGFVGVK